MRKTILITGIALLLTACNFFNSADKSSSSKTAPTLGEVYVTEITATKATLKSKIEKYGNYSSYKERGFAYGRSPKPYDSGNFIAAADGYSSEFSVTLNGLEPNTLYYVAPYITMSDDQTYIGRQLEVCFTTKVQGDYSSALVASDNPKVEVHLRECYRNGAQVKLEATILNKEVTAYTNYYIYQNNYGYKIGNYTFNSRIEDDMHNSYADNAVTKDLAAKSSSYALTTQLPIGATKILTVVVDGVPSNVQKISIYLATEFRDASPKEYAYLTFENVPIY